MVNINENNYPQIALHFAARLNHYIVVIGCNRDTEDFQAIWTQWTYNLYTEVWRKHTLPEENHAPSHFKKKSCVVFGEKVYFFGSQLGFDGFNEFWELTHDASGLFVWNIVQEKDGTKKPSPRSDHNVWEYENKLWVFGGNGAPLDNYLNDYGHFYKGWNNQLLQFNFVTKEWTNMKCLGEVPSPRGTHVATTIGNTVLLFEEKYHYFVEDFADDLYQLDMCMFTWTQIQTGHRIQNWCYKCKQLILN